jgi:hypothetical protein
MLLLMIVDVNFFSLQIVLAVHIDRLAFISRFNLIGAGNVPTPDG